MLNEDYTLLPNNVKIFRGAVINLKPVPTNTTSRKIGKTYKDTAIGKNTVIYPNAVIYASVTIGKNCLIGSNVTIREGCRIGDNVLIANGVTLNYNVTIGNKVKIMDNSHITGGMYIKDGAFISCLVATTNDNSPSGRGTCNPPVVCENAFVGAHATLLSGVIVFKGAKVGAGAVVTKDVPSYRTVIGVPARVIKW